MTATGVQRIGWAGVLGIALLTATLALAGCSSSDGGSDAAGSSGSRVSRVAGSTADQAAGSPVQEARAQQVSQVAQPAAVISTGDVALGSRDVGRVLDGVRAAVAGYGGSVQKESTHTDRAGTPVSSELIVRVPSAQFTAAMHDLGRLGTLESISSSTKDVTTVVLDNRVRVQVARRSIDRITALLDRATSIKEVIAIESELAQRQADLASLESQQKYLADQTSLATIWVSIDQTSTPPPAAKQGHIGFAAGLGAGWRALGHTATAVATALGALLPWLVVLGLVTGLALPARRPARRLARRLARRRRSAPGSSA